MGRNLMSSDGSRTATLGATQQRAAVRDGRQPPFRKNESDASGHLFSLPTAQDHPRLERSARARRSWKPATVPRARNRETRRRAGLHSEGVSNRRVPRAPQAAIDASDESYEAQLDRWAECWGTIGQRLLDNEAHRAAHLRALSNDHDALIRGIAQASAALAWVASWPQLPESIGHLLADAQDSLAQGVESVLTQLDPRTLDESRLLMEIEVLLRDFAAEPHRLDEWATVEPHRRHQLYRFGLVLKRQEAQQGLTKGQVLPDYHEYACHSHAVHPSPRSAKLSPVGDEMTGVFADLADLLQHGMRVYDAALGAVRSLVPGDGPGPDGPSPKFDQVDRAFRLVSRFNKRAGLHEEPRPEYMLRKVTLPTEGTVGGAPDTLTPPSADR